MWEYVENSLQSSYKFISGKLIFNFRLKYSTENFEKLAYQKIIKTIGCFLPLQLRVGFPSVNIILKRNEYSKNDSLNMC